jgi:maleylpyruvate isomerase
MEVDPEIAIGLCQESHGRLLAAVSSLDDTRVRSPSRLPGWSVGHVLTHLARNADGHARRLEGALEGRETARYPGGEEQRDREIEEGAGRPAAEMIADLRRTSERLEGVWLRSSAAGWPNASLLAGDRFPTSGSPARRLREVEMHHVDLGLGYTPAAWPDGYVEWELQASLERLPRRFADGGDARRFLAWLTGRAGWPEGMQLLPWL